MKNKKKKIMSTKFCTKRSQQILSSRLLLVIIGNQKNNFKGGINL